jgi:pimeloyl-ACP methyl ester carboxylesterase
MQLDVLLVHGFLGAPADFRDLAERLAETDGVETITALRLPLHGEVNPPPFQTETFIGCVSEAIGRAACRKRGLVILGHSTGGNLVLSALKNVSIMLRLLILAAVPRRIDLSYLDRWHQLTSQRSAIPLSSVAAMVTLINGTSAAAMRRCLSVLAIHGACDGLVPVSDLQRWQAERDSIPLRTVAIPEAGHALFAGPGSDLAIDAVCRAISDASRWAGETQKSLKALTAIEPEMGEFLAASPFSAAHLLQSPSGRQCLCQSPPMTPAATGEPVFANIEITTRCDLQCRYCARSFRLVRPQEMSLVTFERILDLLPHAYRITLVGLG